MASIKAPHTTPQLIKWNDLFSTSFLQPRVCLFVFAWGSFHCPRAPVAHADSWSFRANSGKFSPMLSSCQIKLNVKLNKFPSSAGIRPLLDVRLRRTLSLAGGDDVATIYNLQSRMKYDPIRLSPNNKWQPARLISYLASRSSSNFWLL